MNCGMNPYLKAEQGKEKNRYRVEGGREVNEHRMERNIK